MYPPDRGRILILLGIAVCALAAAQPVAAALTVYTDRPTFEAVGTILQYADFEEFDPDTTTVVEDLGTNNWYHKGLNYDNPMIVYGGNSGYGPGGSNVLSDSFGAIGGGFGAFVDPFAGYVDPLGYDLLGLDLVSAPQEDGSNQITLDVFSTTGGLPVQDTYIVTITNPATFIGVQADSGDLITGFHVSSVLGYEVYLDNVTLSSTAIAIPEPTSVALVAAIAPFVLRRTRRFQ